VKDMKEEDALYQQADQLVDYLHFWIPKSNTLPDAIIEIATGMAENKFWPVEEVDHIKAWLHDLQSIGYNFPEFIVKKKTSIAQKKTRKIAVCMTGSANRVIRAFVNTIPSLLEFAGNNSTGNDIDVFYYMSTYQKTEKDIHFLKMIPAKIGIIYDDKNINPNVNPTATLGLRKEISSNNLFQQLYALDRCYNIAESYSIQNNVEYLSFARIRSDHELHYLASHKRNFDVTKKYVVIPKRDSKYSGFENSINDRFAIGPMPAMKYYMTRYHHMADANISTLHAESFLKYTLQKNNVSYIEEDFVYYEIPHSPRKETSLPSRIEWPSFKVVWS
jgi:hypothetical protein